MRKLYLKFESEKMGLFKERWKTYIWVSFILKLAINMRFENLKSKRFFQNSFIEIPFSLKADILYDKIFKNRIVLLHYILKWF